MITASFCRSCGFISHKAHAFEYCPNCAAKLSTIRIKGEDYYPKSKEWWLSHAPGWHILRYDPWTGKSR